MNRSRMHTIRLSMFAVLAAAPLVAPMNIPGAPSVALASAKPDRKNEARKGDELPANAQEVAAAMKSAKAGDTITLRGRLTCSAVLAEGVSEFTLVDDGAAKPCDKGQAAPEASSEVPAESAAIVRLANSSGKALKESLSGKNGPKPGAEVFVTGTVASANGADVLVVNAKSIHVPKASLPAGFFKDAHDQNARDVSEARARGGLKVGDRVVLRGRIGGSADPFVDGRAVFTLMGSKLKACNENPDDKCAKPWDYCCEPKEAILANSATVQVVDDKGAILKTGIKGRRGIKELSEVVVVGTVAADGKALVVNATEMSVSRP